MFGSMEKRKTNASEVRFNMEMMRMEAQDRLFSIAINCRQCNDLGVLAVGYISIDAPDEPYVEYNRCSCGAEVHPKLVSFMADQ